MNYVRNLYPISNSKTSLGEKTDWHVEVETQFWQQAVSSKLPLIKRANFFRGNIKNFGVRLYRRSLAPTWKGADRSYGSAPASYLKAGILAPHLWRFAFLVLLLDFLFPVFFQ
jgi:hypothetical protein